MHKLIIIGLLFLIVSCNSKSIKNENKVQYRNNIESVKAILSNDSVSSILATTREIAKQKTYRDAIPFLENVLKNNSLDDKNKLRLELQLSEYYLLFYLIENKKEYFDKANTLFDEILVRDSSLTNISGCLDVNSETLKEFKSKWQSTTNQNSREELMIKALIEKFKITN